MKNSLINIVKGINRVLSFRIHKKLNRLLIAILLLVFNISLGTLAYSWLENWRVLEAFYMTVITLGTVGFQEVHPLSDGGRLFTAIFILLNLVFFTFVATIFTSYLLEGELRNILTNYLSLQKMRKFKDHVIICGFGRNGGQVTEAILRDKMSFVVVDIDFSKFKPEMEEFSKTKYGSFIQGDATQDDTLKKAGIDRAFALITTLPSDADNVFVTLTARQLNPNIKIIARANEASSELKLMRAGAARTVRPDLIGGMYMANLVTRPEVVDFLDMFNGTGVLKLEEFFYEDFNKDFQEKSILELNIRNKSGVSIIGIKDTVGKFVINPHPGTILVKGEVIIVLGTYEQIANFAEHYTSKKLREQL